MTPMVVAIDGPSGSGKSTAARLLAERLGVPYLDTGAMYRALGLKVLQCGVEPRDRAAVAQLVNDTELCIEPGAEGQLEVVLDGEPVGPRIRSSEVGEVSSLISTYREVRRPMVRLQRQAANRYGGVVEGRDIGTRVFPDTPFKFFLEARPEVRAQRRFEQLRPADQEISLEAVKAEIGGRDKRDRRRSESPLACDDTYALIDTSELEPSQVVDEMVRVIEEKSGGDQRPATSDFNTE